MYKAKRKIRANDKAFMLNGTSQAGDIYIFLIFTKSHEKGKTNIKFILLAGIVC